MSGAGTMVETGTILDRILRQTTLDVERRRGDVSIEALAERAAERTAPVGLRSALAGPTISVIAEFKRASPSRGLFPVDIDPAGVTREYLDGGASAISVLTDAPFFKGSLDDLAMAANVAHGWEPPTPVIRKDFVLDPYQIVEARAFGADAFLLIVAALTDTALRDLMEYGEVMGMDALVEVHDNEELDRATAAGATLIGINNRDLRTFEIDLAVSERLAPKMPPGTVVVGESGIFSRADVERLHRAGVHAVLVGESLILAPDRSAAVAGLLGNDAVVG